MKQVTCSQMRVVSENDLRQISGGATKGDVVDKAKNKAMSLATGSPGCVAGAQQAAQGNSPGRWGKGKKG